MLLHQRPQEQQCQLLLPVLWHTGCNSTCNTKQDCCPEHKNQKVIQILADCLPLMALARESIVSMSKWFVGSSSNSMCGVCIASHEKTTLLRKPSDSCAILEVCAFPVMPKRPTCDLIFSTPPAFGNSLICGTRTGFSRNVTHGWLAIASNT